MASLEIRMIYLAMMTSLSAAKRYAGDDWTVLGFAHAPQLHMCRAQCTHLTPLPHLHTTQLPPVHPTGWLRSAMDIIAVGDEDEHEVDLGLHAQVMAETPDGLDESRQAVMTVVEAEDSTAFVRPLTQQSAGDGDGAAARPVYAALRWGRAAIRTVNPAVSGGDDGTRIPNATSTSGSDCDRPVNTAVSGGEGGICSSDATSSSGGVASRPCNTLVGGGGGGGGVAIRPRDPAVGGGNRRASR